MTHSHLSEFIKDKEHLKGVQQERLLIDVASLIYSTMRSRGLNRKQLAQLLGVSKGRVTQYLCGERNLTLRTLADIFTALNSTVCVKSENRESGWKTIEVVRARTKVGERKPKMSYIPQCLDDFADSSLAA